MIMINTGVLAADRYPMDAK
jgi:ribosomal protein L34